eukprot:1163766-Pleurochrysis_carterae.AAC.1
MALVAQTGSGAVTDHDLDAPVVCRVWSHRHDIKFRQTRTTSVVRSRTSAGSKRIHHRRCTHMCKVLETQQEHSQVSECRCPTASHARKDSDRAEDVCCLA